jgi:hypothetical protein
MPRLVRLTNGHSWARSAGSATRAVASLTWRPTRMVTAGSASRLCSQAGGRLLPPLEATTM